MKKMYTKLCVLAAACGSMLGSAVASAAPYPDAPIHLVVGYAAGGGTDLVARALAPYLAQALGQAVIVDNRPGAGGSAGAGFVARARPDGYNVLVTSASSVTITPLINHHVGYTQQNFTPITQISIAPLVLAINKNLGIHSVPELIRAAKAAPGKFNYASSGLGSGPHLAGVLFDLVAGTKMVHVPYRSGAPAVLSVMTGETQLTFATTPSIMPSIRGGQVLGLAVSTQAPSSLVPELPGMQKAGLPGYEIYQWNGLFVPAGTPSAIVNKLFVATQQAMKQPSVQKALELEGTAVAVSKSPADFAAFLKTNAVFWQKLVKSSGITPQ